MIYLKVWPDVGYGDNGDEFYDEIISGNSITRRTAVD
jgi:hypothetical protein